MYIYMSCLICCCACALICFTVGEWETFFSIPLYVLTCKVIDNKATLTLTLTLKVQAQSCVFPVAKPQMRSQCLCSINLF